MSLRDVPNSELRNLHKHELIQLIEDLRLENEQCFLLLEELTMQWTNYDDYGAECIHCKSKMYSSGRCDHHLDCPIVVANELLEGKE